MNGALLSRAGWCSRCGSAAARQATGPWWHRGPLAVLLSLAYVGAWLRLDAIAASFEASQEVSLWYPPAGLTIVLLLVFGLRYTPAALLAEVLHGWLVGSMEGGWAGVVFRAAVSTTVYAGCSYWLLHRAKIDPRLPGRRDMLWFLTVACLAGPLLVAVVQVIQYNVIDVLTWSDLVADVAGYWSGRVTGIGIVAALLLVASRRVPALWPGRPPLPTSTAGYRSGWGLLEPVSQAVLLGASMFAVYGMPTGAGAGLDVTYLVYIPIIWIAVRGGFTHVVAAIFLANVLAVALVGGAVTNNPLRLQLGLATLTMTGLSLGAFMSQRRADMVAARHAAQHAALTGLSNRVRLMDRLAASMRRRGDSSAVLALLYVDLDRFKAVNVAFGHKVGDALLAEVARRLERTAHSANLVSRLGGDEFAILLDDGLSVDDGHSVDDRIRDESAATQVSTLAQRLLEEMRRPFPVDGHELTVTASVGIAIADVGTYGARRQRAPPTSPARCWARCADTVSAPVTSSWRSPKAAPWSTRRWSGRRCAS